MYSFWHEKNLSTYTAQEHRHLTYKGIQRNHRSLAQPGFCKSFPGLVYWQERSVSNNNHGCCKSWQSVEAAGWTTEGLITSGLSFLWSTRMCLLADDYSVQPCCSRINECSFHFFPVEDQFSCFFSRCDIF